MAKELFNSDFYTLPEQVQINKEDIETNTTDIAKLKDDISKIKPNAWEEKKFKLIAGDGESFVCSTYNPITNESNPIVNNQRVFTDKDTYTFSDKINSYSFSVSTKDENNIVTLYVLCGDPTLTINDILNTFANTSKNGIIFSHVITEGTDNEDGESSALYINCYSIKTNDLTTESLTIGNGISIDKISTDDDKSNSSILTAGAVDLFYLKKTDASKTYLTKTDASNTYVTIQDYDERYDTGDISLTQAGYNKIKSMAENIGTTITLTATSDFTENTQVSNTRELILSVNYNGNPIYRNIYLMPNQTIDDYAAYQDATEENWYTGHAMLVLPSQDYGYFAISYQNGTRSQLILTLIAHY